MSDMYNNQGQGESFYQWTPYDDGRQPKKPKKQKTFLNKIGQTALIALVFGLIAGITFESVITVSHKMFGRDVEIEQTQTSDDESGPVTSTDTTEGATTVSNIDIATDVSDITGNVLPAIVQVTNVGLVEYQTFFGTYQQEVNQAGSGIIISQDDKNIYIATNNHVVSGAETLTITFSDGEAVEGTIKGTDSSCDLAVVSVPVKKIPEKTLSTIKIATLGDSDKVDVGEFAIVVGNAMGYGTSVTTGIVSAKDREVSVEDDAGNVVNNKLIQTDAAVNPGNSGGALLNAKGEVIGIVSVKLVDTRTEGMGYAIPISFAWDIIKQMIDNDEVSALDASYLGIAGYDVTAEDAEKYDVPLGIYVMKVAKDSGAEAAGIEEKDVITSFNGRTVTSFSTLDNIMKYIPAGTTVDVTVAKASNNYKEETVQVTLTHKAEDMR
ncbi:S1C family serine protease [Pseudobutyrivibrio sp.]|jgi:serine protease Do|uniref:S1C family serine protease n=1 Tax=Pseudobutyrivibrio sp. TaxID=2014367 RepID=UPI0025E132B4|nr:trypsin-like peptidase domain-containing protein [Pseudobutyrivibrio sp.]